MSRQRKESVSEQIAREALEFAKEKLEAAVNNNHEIPAEVYSATKNKLEDCGIDPQSVLPGQDSSQAKQRWKKVRQAYVDTPRIVKFFRSAIDDSKTSKPVKTVISHGYDRAVAKYYNQSSMKENDTVDDELEIITQLQENAKHHRSDAKNFQTNSVKENVLDAEEVLRHLEMSSQAWQNMSKAVEQNLTKLQDQVAEKEKELAELERQEKSAKEAMKKNLALKDEIVKQTEVLVELQRRAKSMEELKKENEQLKQQLKKSQTQQARQPKDNQCILL